MNEKRNQKTFIVMQSDYSWKIVDEATYKNPPDSMIGNKASIDSDGLTEILVNIHLLELDLLYKLLREIFDDKIESGMKCKHCGNKEFYASQSCSGSVDVIVDGLGEFMRNTGAGEENDGRWTPDGLNFDSPEGPFECVRCGKEYTA